MWIGTFALDKPTQLRWPLHANLKLSVRNHLAVAQFCIGPYSLYRSTTDPTYYHRRAVRPHRRRVVAGMQQTLRRKAILTWCYMTIAFADSEAATGQQNGQWSLLRARAIRCPVYDSAIVGLRCGRLICHRIFPYLGTVLLDGGGGRHGHNIRCLQDSWINLLLSCKSIGLGRVPRCDERCGGARRLAAMEHTF